MDFIGKQKSLAVGVAAAVLLTLPQLALADLEINKYGVTLGVYAVLDAGYGYLEHSYGGSSVFASTVNPYNLNSSSGSFNGIYTGGVSMSRWGVRGDVDLGSDRKGFFKLESAIDVNSGQISNNGQSIFNAINSGGARPHSANGASAINGQLFSRAAYLGISDPLFGSLEIGRTTNFSLDQVNEYDPVQNALLFSPLGFSGGIGGGLGATENTRLDNSIKYENKLSGSNFGGADWGEVNFGFQYKFATGSTDQSAGSAYVAMLGYSYGPFSLKGTYSQTFDTVAWATQYSNVVSPDANLQIENTQGYMLSGMYKINSDATVKAGYEYSKISAPSNTNLTNIVSYYGIKLPNPAVNASPDQYFETFWVGGDYKFTEKFDLGAGYYYINTHNKPDVVKNYIVNAYSVLADYTFNKYFDTYAAIMITKYSGEGLDKKKPIDAYSSNAMCGTGIRLKF
jgi:predicted porin